MPELPGFPREKRRVRRLACCQGTSRTTANLGPGYDCLAAALSLTLVALALAWYCFSTLTQSWRMGAKSISTLQVPLALPQGVWWIGMFWFAIMAVLVPLQAVAKLLAGRAHTRQRRRHRRFQR